MEHINPGSTVVTTLTYDMVVKDDTNISTEIKDYLTKQLGWRNNIPQLTLKQFGYKDRILYGEDLPASTLWKVSCTPEDAIKDFLAAIEAYNVNHANDTPTRKVAKGKAFAICNVEYDTVEVR